MSLLSVVHTFLALQLARSINTPVGTSMETSMKPSIDGTKLTIAGVEDLMNEGRSAKEILSAIVDDRCITEDTQKELIKFLGVKSLSAAFLNINHIPAGFIEKNLSLVIEGYNSHEVLRYAVEKPDRLSNPLSLGKKLVSEYGADPSKLFFIGSDVDIDFAQFLLSKGMKGNVVLEAALRAPDEERKIKLFELALAYGADINSLGIDSLRDSHISLRDFPRDFLKFLRDECEVTDHYGNLRYGDLTPKQVNNKLSVWAKSRLNERANLKKKQQEESSVSKGSSGSEEGANDYNKDLPGFSSSPPPDEADPSVPSLGQTHG